MVTLDGAEWSLLSQTLWLDRVYAVPTHTHTHTENRRERFWKELLTAITRNGNGYYTGKTIDFTMVHTLKKSTQKLINNQ